MEEEILLFFVYGSRTDAQFFGYELPLLTRDLREFVSSGLKRIVYPYLIDSVDLPVGSGVVFYRPFQRPETQIRELIARTVKASHFEVERATREKGETLERILLEEALSNVYEPIIELADHTVIGYEALIRGPQASGLETPAQLFSVAYKCNLEYETRFVVQAPGAAKRAGHRAGSEALPEHPADFDSRPGLQRNANSGRARAD